MKTKIANVITWLFLPLFSPIYGLLFLLYWPGHTYSFTYIESLYFLPSPAKILFLLLFGVFVLIAPLTSIFILKSNGAISSYKMATKEERLSPIAITSFYWVVLFIFLFLQNRNLVIPPLIKGMTLGGVLASVISYQFTKKIKISLHTLGMGSLLGLIYMYSLRLINPSLWFLLFIILLSGIVGMARMYLKAHQLKEILWGFIIGFATQIIGIYFYTLN